MISLEEARAVAVGYVRNVSSEVGTECVLVDSATQDTSSAFVFYYNTKAFLDTGNSRHALAGNGPLIVTKADGQLHACGSAERIEHYLENLSRYGSLYPPNPQGCSDDKKR